MRFQCSSASRKFLNFDLLCFYYTTTQGFSALQRAENSSIMHYRQRCAGDGRGFSALQRAENSSILIKRCVVTARKGFSALQRAENSSIAPTARIRSSNCVFQCSSASRKFLNRPPYSRSRRTREFQCSSASRKFLNPSCFATIVAAFAVSVLFSEPKIPQYVWYRAARWAVAKFQCSSASRKFLNRLEAAFRSALDFIKV